MSHEEVLVRQACAGDPGAFDLLVSPYMPRFYRLAFLITRDQEYAADAVQEALLRAYRSLRSLRGEAAFRPWFTRILVNEAAKQSRRWRKLLLIFTGQSPDRSLVHANLQETPEAILEAREEQAGLWQAVQQLSTAHRTVLVLRYWEELSEAEMAAVLSIPPGTVKSRLYHARAALEQMLPRAERGGRAAELKLAVQGGESHD